MLEGREVLPFSSAEDAGFSERPATPRATAAGFSENQVPPAVQMKLRGGRRFLRETGDAESYRRRIL
jgi:hypothetical protein